MAATHPRFDSAGLPAPSRRAQSRSRLAALALALLIGGGCSGRGTYITGGPSNGQLKSSLSHLEFENDQLKTQVARLKEENRAIEDRLVQERLHSDTLVTKLDNLRRDRGYGGDSDADLDAPLSSPRTLPAGRTTPPRRKSPAAQISRASDQEDIPPIRIDDAPRSRSSARPARPRTTPSRVQAPDDLGFNADDFNWTPIARGGDDKSAAPPKR